MPPAALSAAPPGVETLPVFRSSTPSPSSSLCLSPPPGSGVCSSAWNPVADARRGAASPPCSRLTGQLCGQAPHSDEGRRVLTSRHPRNPASPRPGAGNWPSRVSLDKLLAPRRRRRHDETVRPLSRPQRRLLNLSFRLLKTYLASEFFSPRHGWAHLGFKGPQPGSAPWGGHPLGRDPGHRGIGATTRAVPQPRATV